mgnify:CR=1 FL=1
MSIFYSKMDILKLGVHLDVFLAFVIALKSPMRFDLPQLALLKETPYNGYLLF